MVSTFRMEYYNNSTIPHRSRCVTPVGAKRRDWRSHGGLWERGKDTKYVLTLYSPVLLTFFLMFIIGINRQLITSI